VELDIKTTILDNFNFNNTEHIAKSSYMFFFCVKEADGGDKRVYLNTQLNFTTDQSALNSLKKHIKKSSINYCQKQIWYFII